MKVVEIKQIVNGGLEGKEINVHGWVKTNRDSGKISFFEINDGSCLKNLQIVAKDGKTEGYDTIVKSARTGSSITASGVVKKSLKTNDYEIEAVSIKLLKQADEDYPLQKKEHSLEFLRDIAHLRPRTTTISAIMRVRSKLAYAVHKFFQENDFI
jgi:asparaginyl-tRNA synthetase